MPSGSSDSSEPVVSAICLIADRYCMKIRENSICSRKDRRVLAEFSETISSALFILENLDSRCVGANSCQLSEVIVSEDSVESVRK